MSRARFWVAVMILIIGVSCANLDDLSNHFDKNEDEFSSTTFKMAVLLPNIKDLRIANIHQNGFKLEEDTHHIEIMSKFFKSYSNKGGSIHNAYAIVKNGAARKMNSPILLNLVAKPFTSKPLRLQRRNKDVLVIPYASVEN